MSERERFRSLGADRELGPRGLYVTAGVLVLVAVIVASFFRGSLEGRVLAAVSLLVVAVVFAALGGIAQARRRRAVRRP